MQNLIKIEKTKIGTEETNSVNAYDVWKYLESKQKFADWIKKRLNQLGAIENEDWIRFSNLGSGIGQESINYIVTLDIAKHLGMMERNQKGRELRQYFIDIEKKYIEQLQRPLLKEELDLIKAKTNTERSFIDKEAFGLEEVGRILWTQNLYHQSGLKTPHIPLLETKHDVLNRNGIYILFDKKHKKEIKLILEKYVGNNLYGLKTVYNRNGHTGTDWVYKDNILDVIKTELGLFNFN